jgi:carbonic anhydrase/acetyltransferase-like protein (isoleucine patch superfamily)
MAVFRLDDRTPSIDPTAWVADNAQVIGSVVLHEDASVWFGAVLRGDNDWIEIGENSNIQDNSVCHTDPGLPVTIGANVTVGHNVILHSTTVGDNSLVGMGSILLNRSKVGSNCLIGASTLISEGKEFGDGSMILGSPGRVQRTLGERELAILKIAAQTYVHNSKRFREGLRRLD